MKKKNLWKKKKDTQAAVHLLANCFSALFALFISVFFILTLLNLFTLPILGLIASLMPDLSILIVLNFSALSMSGFFSASAPPMLKSFLKLIA